MRRKLAVAFATLLLPTLLSAQSTAEHRQWNTPIRSFRVVDNIYYVGATDISSFLITSPQGHVLLDGGFAETAPIILANIRALGFNPRDVKTLLVSHGHLDHAGGLAELKQATGARFLASAPDSALIAHGGRGDFRWGDSATFPALVADQTVRDGEQITVGSTTLIAHITPGHTRGCTTWTMTVRDGATPRDVLFSCSYSAPGYRLVGNADYPEIVADYRRSFAALRELKCDVLLAPHGWDFHLATKVTRADSTPNPFVDPAECKAYIDAAERAIESAVQKQMSARRAPPRD
jgi:metallo-beta-lactamase class B